MASVLGVAATSYSSKDVSELIKQINIQAGTNLGLTVSVQDNQVDHWPFKPNMKIQILLTYFLTFHRVLAGGFVKRSKQFPFDDHFIHSHNLFPWLCIDIVRRTLMLVTLRAFKGLLCPRYNIYVTQYKNMLKFEYVCEPEP